MGYDITALATVRLPFLDGGGRLYGLIEAVGEVGQPATWSAGKWQPIETLPPCVGFAANRSGGFACDLGEGRGLIHDGETSVEISGSGPYLMNDRLQVVARDSDKRPFLWERGKVTPLPLEFNATAMNGEGVIAGNLLQKEQTRVPALWQAGELTTIVVDGLPLHWAEDINDAGQVLVNGWIHDGDGERVGAAQGVWSAGKFTPIPVPYEGHYLYGSLNSRGEALCHYWIDVGPPYVYEESIFLWKDGTSADVNALTKGHIAAAHGHGIDDLGQLLVSGEEQTYLLSPQGAESPRGPMKRPDVPPRFVLFREPSNVRSLRFLGLPGASRLGYYFEKLFGRGAAQSAYEHGRVRIGEREIDPVAIFDDTGITTPTYGYMPWHWIERVLAIDLEGILALSICLNRCPEWHDRFPEAKAFLLWLGRELEGGPVKEEWAGGPVEEGQCELIPLTELYPRIEAFANLFLPERE